MKIYLDSDGILHVEERTYDIGVNLVFIRSSNTKFDIRIAETDDTILGKEIDLLQEKCFTELDVAYANVDAIYTAIKSSFFSSGSSTDGSQKTQVVDPNGVNVDFATATKQTDGSQKTQLVDASGNQITLSSGEPRILSCEYTRPTNTTARPANGAINETVSVIKELISADAKQAANLNGGGGVVINGSIVSNNTADVGRQFGIIFLREDISPIIADNAVQTMLYANQGKRIMVVYATMEAQSAGSDVVIGRFNLPFEYQCKADSKVLKALLFDVTGGTTASGSKYMVSINVQVQK